MEINVGEYVRTKYGIAKVIRNCTDDKTYFDCFDIDRELDGCNFINDFEIKKHSKNIMDLIEGGDYVNGERIDYITTSNLRNGELILMTDGGYDLFKKYNSITSIVTKEQFAEMEYKVGD